MKVKDIIIQIDKNTHNPLRKEAILIKKNEFGTPYLKEVVSTMQKALAKESDGVALAAPQIALSLRMFVVSPEAYSPEAKWKPLVFINPKITKISKKKATMQEGCLSVRWIYGKTNRSTSATVEAYDVEGNKFTYGATGLIAHIFQHEIDHLDGVLFIDHGFDFEEFTEDEIRAGENKMKEDKVKAK
ncbi:peptide deformylase [Candidatus Gracilibacteria bacterium]|nr:peptide deformylase [Candidatus Gracilibacteria bacterium]MCF7898683.1 peptide deformylase [Candidatus Paceibacterota bacterium]